ncbi:hypothetical protein D918_09629 [Trichuris suis]|nr:hypothetical protein D918_09629 [Trichuris suis]
MLNGSVDYNNLRDYLITIASQLDTALDAALDSQHELRMQMEELKNELRRLANADKNDDGYDEAVRLLRSIKRRISVSSMLVRNALGTLRTIQARMEIEAEENAEAAT